MSRGFNTDSSYAYEKGLLEIDRLKEERLKLLIEKEKLVNNLPHKYKFKLYPWQRKFLEDNSRTLLLTKANQLGGSTIQIIKLITLATEPEIWDRYFFSKPSLFLYLMPSFDLFRIEFEEKWVKELLPKNEYKEKGKYSWEIIGTKSKPMGIKFINTGINVYFKTYAQKAMNLQAMTCDAIFMDEECDSKFYDELNQRRVAKNGLFSAVFTPTLGDPFWMDVFRKGTQEKLKDASKYVISLFDCLKYEDGTDSTIITQDVINKRIALCKNDAEVQRRIYGKWTKDEGLIFPYFSTAKHVINQEESEELYRQILKEGWSLYGGVDLGFGGGKNDPCAICITALSPDAKSLYVIDTFLGDEITTTALDTANIYKNEFASKYILSNSFYDSSDKDFYTFVSQMDIPFTPAKKNIDHATRLINVLLKANRIKILTLSTSRNFHTLANDFMLLSYDKNKKHLGHLLDAFKYSMSSLNIDINDIEFSSVNEKEKQKKLKPLNNIKILNIDEERALQSKEMFLDKPNIGEWMGYIDYD